MSKGNERALTSDERDEVLLEVRGAALALARKWISKTDGDIRQAVDMARLFESYLAGDFQSVRSVRDQFAWRLGQGGLEARYRALSAAIKTAATTGGLDIHGVVFLARQFADYVAGPSGEAREA